MRDVLAIEHSLEGKALHARVGLVHGLAQGLAPAGHAQHAPARGEDLVALDLGSAMEDNRVIRVAIGP